MALVSLGNSRVRSTRLLVRSPLSVAPGVVVRGRLVYGASLLPGTTPRCSFFLVVGGLAAVPLGLVKHGAVACVFPCHSPGISNIIFGVQLC